MTDLPDMDLSVQPGPAKNPGGEALRAHLQKLKEERAQYIEMFSAAFLNEVGVAKASKYRLVETITHKKERMVTTWEFQKR